LVAGSVWLSQSNAAMLCIVKSTHGISHRVIEVTSPDPSFACLCLSASSETVWCVLANGSVYVRAHVSVDTCPQGRSWQRVNLEQLGGLLSIVLTLLIGWVKGSEVVLLTQVRTRDTKRFTILQSGSWLAWANDTVAYWCSHLFPTPLRVGGWVDLSTQWISNLLKVACKWCAVKFETWMLLIVLTHGGMARLNWLVTCPSADGRLSKHWLGPALINFVRPRWYQLSQTITIWSVGAWLKITLHGYLWDCLSVYAPPVVCETN